MSREILFRGKRIDNGEWVEGFYVKHGSRHWIYTGEMQYMYLPVCADLPTKYEVSTESACQYTGLTDKNGRKIFEGDIVGTVYDGNANPNYVVVWDSEELDFKVTNGEEHYKHNFEYLGCCEEIVVIGNIFVNPELLNQ